ncbi:tetraacyldisaccharide 4'-kinase [Ramlibacter sp.]|uniref:tetraacyldisaccharide 4'-kinase n=1 Tax=Ramlibacter sp. TaxID=1917967 RepID=UPI003D14E36C
MRAALQRAWLRRGAAARLLWPLSLPFALLAALRQGAYRIGLLATYRAPIPVVVVGNVVAGGAGKTPLVVAVAQHLRERGLRPGIVSRGYGRDTADCREVHAESAAADVGDEPLLVKRHTALPVFVSRDRPEAVRALLAAHPGTQAIVSDDGLQHFALARDIEIVVFDEGGIGNGLRLPAGPLREAWPRHADLVVCHGGPKGIEGHRMARMLADWAVRADGTQFLLNDLQGPLKAVAGIANPEVFFRMLRERGVPLAATQALPDHFDFDAGIDAEGCTLLCTEKDAVKLWRTHPRALAVPLLVDVEPAFWRELDRLLDAKLSSVRSRT